MLLNSFEQNNKKINLENKRFEIVQVDINDYEFVVVFNAFFCESCFGEDFCNKRILFIYNENLDSKMQRVSICNKISKKFVNSDVFFKENTKVSDLNVLIANDIFIQKYFSEFKK
jgi:hypothetical protein